MIITTNTAIAFAIGYTVAGLWTLRLAANDHRRKTGGRSPWKGEPIYANTLAVLICVGVWPLVLWALRR